MQEQTLKEKTYNGFLWSFIERFLVQFIQFFLGILLARILCPADFGLLGLMTVFIALSRLFVDSGLSSALIQKQNRTEVDFATVFYFNTAVCFICYIIVFFGAPYISAFYNIPELTKIIRIFFVSLIIDSFSAVQYVKLMIKLDFRKRAIYTLFSVIISGAVSVWMAYAGYGVWALVMQAIAYSLSMLIIITIGVRWRPLFVFSKTSFKQLWGFGSKMLGAIFIDTVSEHLSVFLLGRYYSKEHVGYYTKGLQVPVVLSGVLTSMLQNVTYPVMASIQDNKEYLIGVYKRIISMVSFIIIPAMCGLAFLAEPFVRYALTEKWMPSVILIQWFCFARIFTPINLLNMTLLNSVGRSDINLKVNLIRFPMSVIMLLITIPIGLEAIAIGLLILTIINFFITSFMPGKLFGYGGLSQLKDMLPAFFSSGIMIAVLFLTTYNIENDLKKMILSLIFGSASYIIVNILLKTEGIKEIRHVIVGYYRKVRADKKS